MSAVLLVAALAAVVLCVVAVGARIERAIDRIPRTAPPSDIDEQVAAFRAELDAYEESNR